MGSVEKVAVLVAIGVTEGRAEISFLDCCVRGIEGSLHRVGGNL